MKKFPLLSMVLATIFLLAACSGSNAPLNTDLNVQEPSSLTPTNEETSLVEAESEAKVLENDPSTPVTETPEATIYVTGVIQPFDQKKFEAAQADNKRIFLDFYASWCPTCRANAPIIEAGLKDSDVVAFRVNYDTATDLKKDYKVTYQSTYILLEGESEKRKVGMLTEDDMKSLIPLVRFNPIVF